MQLLDPTSERAATSRAIAPRLTSFDGVTIALLDITKPRGDVFLDRIEQLLNERNIATKRYRKPTYTKPAPPDLRFQIAQECQAVIEALAD